VSSESTTEAEPSLPSLNIEEDLWVELEVPYGKIKQKWEDRYEAELREHVEKRRINQDVLEIYTTLAGIFHTEEREEALDEILAHDERWGYNLLCLKLFADYKNAEYFKQYKSFLYKESEGTDLQSVYHQCYSSTNKIGLAGFLQLFDDGGNRLKTIHGLNYCDQKKPQLVSTDSELTDFDPKSDAEDIVEKMQSDHQRAYELWHSFEYDDRDYVMIKREVDDDVERQAQGNIQKEPGEFIVLRYAEDQLEIISSTKKIAGRTRTGINQTIDDVNFEDVDAGAGRQDLEKTVEGLLTGDSVGPTDDETSTDIDLGRFTVTGLKLSSSPLPGHPKIDMKSDEGIRRAIRALQDVEFDLLASIDDIDIIYTDFDGREYSIRPKEQERIEGEVSWTFKYDAHSPSREERKDFERLIEDLFEINVIFEQT